MRSLLCFGDSNTHGTVAMTEIGARGRFDPESRWPGVMARALGPGWRVVEEGHPGRTTVLDDPVEGAHRNGARHLTTLLESHRPLDLVIVMLGVNDLKARFSLTPGDIAMGAERLARMVATSDTGPEGQAPRCLMVAPPPVAETGCLAEMFSGAAEKSRALAARFAEAAARAGAAFFDAGDVAEVDPLDGVHLDAAAHAALGGALAAKVTELMGEKAC